MRSWALTDSILVFTHSDGEVRDPGKQAGCRVGSATDQTEIANDRNEQITLTSTDLTVGEQRSDTMNFFESYKPHRSALWKATLLFILVAGLLIAADQLSISLRA